MFTTVLSMRDGYLGRNSSVKHRVDLELQTVRVDDLVLYLSGTRTRDFERSETENMMEISVIRPVQTDWASPFFFLTKNRLDFEILN